MTRLDDQSSPDPWLHEKSEKEKMKEEIREKVMDEIKDKKRKRRIIGCSLIFMAVCLLFGFIGTGVAKSGLYEVPVLSKFFSSKATPQKLIVLTPEELRDSEIDITQKLKNQVEPKIEPGATGQKVAVSLKFTEREMTAFLKSLESSGESPLRNSQVVVTPDEIEVFGELYTPNKTYLTVSFRPEIWENELTISLKKFKIGSLSLPVSWGNFLANKFLESQMKSSEEAIRKIGKLEKISLGAGELSIDGLVDVLILMQQK
jgi:hypothetical protein